MFKKNFITLILAAGGTGSRMAAAVPKQYIPLLEKPIALYSFELFCQMDQIDEIVVVAEPQYRSLFQSSQKPLSFALPGQRRQDSIFNGFLAASSKASILCTHDAARPFIDKTMILSLLEKTVEIGAATLAAPVICTIKQSNPHQIIEKTLDRSHLWEIQTPQAMKRSLFEQGFAYVNSHGIEVTDDVSLAENLNHPVAIVPSSRKNFKITTPTDLAVAQTLLYSQCATN